LDAAKENTRVAPPNTIAVATANAFPTVNKVIKPTISTNK
jgi:hypothetical protein